MKHASRALLSAVPAVLVALTVPLVPGCGKRTSSEGMPPATGEGAPPRAALPAVAPALTSDRSSTGTQRTTGTTYPLDRAEVSPDMSGILESIEVEEGSAVKKGQVLFRMRTNDLALGVRQTRAALRSAKVARKAAKVEYDRMRRLLEQKATEQAQLDRVKAQYDSATAAVAQAQVALAQTRRSLTDAAMRSPIDGVVTEVRKNAGEMATMMPITVVLVVEDQSTLELRFRLPESALAALVPGDTVMAEFEAIKSERAARVHRMSPAIDVRTRTFEVIARIDNRDGKLRSGMLAIVKLGAADKAAASDAAAVNAAASDAAAVNAAAGKPGARKPGARRPGARKPRARKPGAGAAGQPAAGTARRGE